MRRYWLLVFILLGLMLSQLNETFAQPQELVTDGGFEDGFTGWSHTNSQVVSMSSQGYFDAMSHPPHSGEYSAEVGSATRLGTISQKVTIPPRSVATFEAWYRLEQGSSLMVYLKNSDGSTIKQWSESGSQSWTTISYDLDLSYAGQTITIEFDGQGNEQLTTQYGYCLDSAGNYYPCPYYSYADYFAFVDDVSLRSTLTQYVATIVAPELPQELAAKLYVDGTQVGNIQGQHSIPLTFKIGERHTISLDNYVYKDNTTRYYCANNSVTVSSDQQITFTYKVQYYLSINNAYDQATGSDWYSDGSTATFSLKSGTVPMPGLAGLLGGKFVFEKWTGSAEDSSLKGTISITGPASISASWKEDYSILYVVVALIIALGAGGLLAYSRLVRGRRKESATQMYEVTPIEREEVIGEPAAKYEATKAREAIVEEPARKTGHAVPRKDRESFENQGGRDVQRKRKRLLIRRPRESSKG
jgi:hypothetical protein